MDMVLKINREDFLKRSVQTLGEILDTLQSRPSIDFGSLVPGRTALVIIDMVNGFAREGALQSPRVEALIDEIAKLSERCAKSEMIRIAFADCHTPESPELDSYPVHCIKGSRESQIVDEIKRAKGYILISKNSTNGFLEEDFQIWLQDNPQVDTFIVTGVCTDICIEQFSITLRAYFNMLNKKLRVIVPINAVETYDFAMHNGDLMHIVALYSMMGNAVELVTSIDT